VRPVLASAAIGLGLWAGWPAQDPSSARAPANCTGTRWVGSWAAAPGHRAPQNLTSLTLRLIVNPHLDGGAARIRLSNRFGAAPVTFGSIFVGQAGTGGSVEVGTNRQVTFGGLPAVRVAPGAEVASDPVSIAVHRFQDLAVSIYVAAARPPGTGHFDGHQISYLAYGDWTFLESGLPFALSRAQTETWQYLTGVDVRVPQDSSAVVAFGDSLTDGYQVRGSGAYARSLSQNQRYPDFLAERLFETGWRRLSVLNAGISGNRVLGAATGTRGLQIGAGPAGVERLDDDVIGQPGASDVVILEGSNDIASRRSAGAVIGGLRRLVMEARRAGLNVLLGTLPPANGSRGHSSPARIEKLETVNRWIRRQSLSDGVVDFDAALRDPRDRTRLAPQFDSGDGLHPSSNGYRRMAQAVRLGMLEGLSCGP
jgi:lysophospholipase L1-like esterase